MSDTLAVLVGLLALGVELRAAVHVVVAARSPRSPRAQTAIGGTVGTVHTAAQRDHRRGPPPPPAPGRHAVSSRDTALGYCYGKPSDCSTKRRSRSAADGTAIRSGASWRPRSTSCRRHCGSRPTRQRRRRSRSSSDAARVGYATGMRGDLTDDTPVSDYPSEAYPPSQPP